MSKASESKVTWKRGRFALDGDRTMTFSGWSWGHRWHGFEVPAFDVATITAILRAPCFADLAWSFDEPTATFLCAWDGEHEWSLKPFDVAGVGRVYAFDEWAWTLANEGG